MRRGELTQEYGSAGGAAMNRCRPLSLSSAQLSLVMAGAAQRPTCRDGYLQRIAAMLGAVANFADADVQQAVLNARAMLENEKPRDEIARA